MKNFKEYLKETVSTATIGSNVLSNIAPTGKAFGLPFFDVDCDSFEKCRTSPKKKYKHWLKLLSSKDIKDFANQNKKSSFLIRKIGSQDYLRAR